jgi:hypothetical protein
MRYSEAMQVINTAKALSLAGLKTTKNGSYLNFPCPKCQTEAVMRYFGEKKNVSYCPTCKIGDNIIAIVAKLKGIEFQEAKTLLIEKTVGPDKPIENELSLSYDLEWCDLMEKEGLDKELCERLGVGRPKGKTMMSGAVAFTIYDEKGLKVAYYGIRTSDRRPVCHKSFNPELYLYNFNNVDPREEAWITTDMFSCLRHLAGGRQCVCNFGLPYLSSRQIELLSPFPQITFEWLFTEKNEIMLNTAQNLKTYHRFV